MDKTGDFVANSPTRLTWKNCLRRLATFYETAALPLSYTGFSYDFGDFGLIFKAEGYEMDTDGGLQGVQG
jgi:hypothetical protein